MHVITLPKLGDFAWCVDSFPGLHLELWIIQLGSSQQEYIEKLCLVFT